MEKIYEIVLKTRCADLEFIRNEWKVFASEEEARAYGLKAQDELNEGLTPEEKADDGYYFEYWFSRPIDEIDGFPVSIGTPKDFADPSFGGAVGTRCHSRDSSLPCPEKHRGRR